MKYKTNLLLKPFTVAGYGGEFFKWRGWNDTSKKRH
jgi:hypothetical protein